MFQASVVESFILSKVVFVGNNSIPIELSTGLDYPSISIEAHQVVSLDTSVLESKRLYRHDTKSTSVLEKTYSPPIAINFEYTSRQYLQAALEAHVAEIAVMKRNIGEVRFKKTTLPSYKLHRAVQGYYETCPNVS